MTHISQFGDVGDYGKIVSMVSEALNADLFLRAALASWLKKCRPTQKSEERLKKNCLCTSWLWDRGAADRVRTALVAGPVEAYNLNVTRYYENDFFDPAHEQNMNIDQYGGNISPGMAPDHDSTKYVHQMLGTAANLTLALFIPIGETMEGIPSLYGSPNINQRVLNTTRVRGLIDKFHSDILPGSFDNMSRYLPLVRTNKDIKFSQDPPPFREIGTGANKDPLSKAKSYYDCVHGLPICAQDVRHASQASEEYPFWYGSTVDECGLGEQARSLFNLIFDEKDLKTTISFPDNNSKKSSIIIMQYILKNFWDPYGGQNAKHSILYRWQLLYSHLSLKLELSLDHVPPTHFPVLFMRCRIMMQKLTRIVLVPIDGQHRMASIVYHAMGVYPAAESLKHYSDLTCSGSHKTWYGTDLLAMENALKPMMNSKSFSLMLPNSPLPRSNIYSLENRVKLIAFYKDISAVYQEQGDASVSRSYRELISDSLRVMAAPLQDDRGVVDPLSW